MMKSNYQKEDKLFWDTHNDDCDNSYVVIRVDGKKINLNNYTSYFFNHYNLNNFLNYKHPRVIQLGCYTGTFLNEIKSLNWDVRGYEFSTPPLNSLEEKKISVRNIDLNQIESSENSTKLAYQDHLEKDLEKSNHIIMVRILEHVDQKYVLPILLYSLINTAKSGSTFFIVSALSNEKQYKRTARQENYICSFFAPRVDMRIKWHTQTKKEKVLTGNMIECMEKKGLVSKNQFPELEANDEIFIVKKI